jgi:hypothetical protein
MTTIRANGYQKRGTRYLYLVNSLKMVFVARGVEPHFGGYSRLNIEASRRGFPVRPRAICGEGRGPCRGRVVKARTEQPLPRLMPCSVSWILVEMADNGFRSLCGNNGKI